MCIFFFYYQIDTNFTIRIFIYNKTAELPNLLLAHNFVLVFGFNKIVVIYLL